MSEGLSISDVRSSLLNLPAYAAHDDFQSYAHWAPLDGRDTADHVVDQNEYPASIVIVGQIMQGRLAVAPLGNYQAQEDKRSYEGNNSNKVACKDAKMVLYLRRPTAFPDWIAEYDIAAMRMNSLQEAVATTKAPRMWFLEQTQRHDQSEKVYIMKFNHALWQKKQISGAEALIPEDDDDDDMKDIREEERDKAQETSMYADIVSDRFKEEFKRVSSDHHIRPPPVFNINGRQVNAGILEARLPEALVEVVFTLRHFHIGGLKGNKSAYGKRHSQAETHTFTANIDHIKILQTSASRPSSSPLRPKVLPRSPVKGKEVKKRTELEDPEDNEAAKKKRRTVNNLSGEASSTTQTPVSSASTIGGDDEPDSSFEEA